MTPIEKRLQYVDMYELVHLKTTASRTLGLSLVIPKLFLISKIKAL